MIGRLATKPNMGDAGSSNVRAPSHVTPLDGIRAAFPDAEIVLVTDADVDQAGAAAANADIAIVIAGYDEKDEGEFFAPALDSNPELRELYPPLPPKFDLS